MNFQLFWLCAALTVMGVSCHMNLPFFGGQMSACDDASNPCSDGKSCFHGRCRTPCNDTDDCSRGKKCGDDGFCARDKDGCDLRHLEFRCNETTSCFEGATCVQGKCSRPCAADADCKSFFGRRHKVCANGFCTKAPSNATDDEEDDDDVVEQHCHDDSGCSQTGTECIDGKCRLTCGAASKCPGGMFCDMSSVNALVSPATVTGVCRKQHRQGRGSFPRRCAEMFLRGRHHEQQHCDAAKPCRPDFDCVGGVCLAKCQNNTCKFGKECGADGYCHRLNFTCSADADCSGNRTCVDSICRTTCDQNHACPQKTVCKEGLCRFEGFFGLSSRFSCDASKACPADSGRVCIDGWCRVACTADQQCSHGKVCHKDGYCTRNFHDDNHDDDDDDHKGKDNDHDEDKDSEDDHDD